MNPRSNPARLLRLLFAAAGAASALALSGCGAGIGASSLSSNPALLLSGGGAVVDTNCTGCNAANARGAAVQRLTATLPDGAGQAQVLWSVSGGDPKAGAGSIDAEGQYTPPGFLTADTAEVTVTARLASDPTVSATTRIAVTPGFLEPLTPENAALGAGGSITLTGRLAEAGGQTAIRFALSGSAAGAGSISSGFGSLSSTDCARSASAFTACTVTYTAPASIETSQVVYLTAAAGAAKTETAILLSPSGISSNPVEHRTGLGSGLSTPAPLGGSGGNNSDLDARGESVSDCCGGTLGALVADNAGHQYLLSNNHVLARSDHGAQGDAIIQPGLIDTNCTPYGAEPASQSGIELPSSPSATPVATLSAWLPLHSATTNADAAIARLDSHMVDSSGAILELGARQGDGSLAAAPPGTSSTGGKGETARLTMQVAKSGRTTGLTCGSVAAVDVDVAVDYFEDCAETRPYLTKIFTHQLGLSGDRFSDAGDSGALVVDAANAEPVGLFFAGGVDASGVVEGLATPAPEVLNELGNLSSGSYTFVGGADHAVSCLSYGDSTISAAERQPLSTVETARASQALYAARALVNPGAGILGVAVGKSSDRAGEAAVVVYIDEAKAPSVPAAIGGVRTVVIGTTPQAVSSGSAPAANSLNATPLSSSALTRAIEIKSQSAHRLMRENAAIFGVGVGQSLDNPREAALVLYVDRNKLSSTSLPRSVSGLRTRLILMDRLHVTRAYSVAGPARHCAPLAAPNDAKIFMRQRLPLPN